jgi:hypothetical protein
MGSCKENTNEEYAPFGVEIYEFIHYKRYSLIWSDIRIMQQKNKVPSDSKFLNALIVRSIP